jgi:dipeptidase D
MADRVSELHPRILWEVFSSILAIPRPSGHEERVAAYVESVAKEHGWEVRRDAAGNLVVKVPATPGRERAPVVIVQGHLDMVCEKNKGVEHDFLEDPIRAAVEGEWVVADGTTLGADNGLGVAAALAAAADPETRHGPLELLFTIDEETGLTGAKQLDASMLEGRTMLNLDSEEDGVIYVGCAGGADTHLDHRVETTRASALARPVTLEVAGLRGGHSGLNIGENRGNAVRLLARVLKSADAAGIPFEIGSIRGGDKHNAIPRESEAVLYLDPSHREALDKTVACALEGFRDELAGVDDGLRIELRDGEGADGEVWSRASRDRMLDVLCSLPHGVLAMSRDLEGLVETSSNLAALKPDGDDYRILTSSRSSVMSAMDGVLESIRAIGRLAGFRTEVQVGYPGWKPDLDSAVLAVVRDVYAGIWGAEPKVTAIHAGLECGLLGEKIPGLDMVSFGPQIEGAHSPDERIHVPSVERFWRALQEVLDRLSR